MSNKITCAWPKCDIKFVPQGKGQLYCTPIHQRYHLNEKEAKIKENIKKEAEQFKWMTSKIGRLAKWYKIFGDKQRCDLCGISFDDALDKYGIPLIMELQLGIRGYKVMDLDSWNRYCKDCYIRIKVGRIVNEANEEQTDETVTDSL